MPDMNGYKVPYGSGPKKAPSKGGPAVKKASGKGKPSVRKATSHTPNAGGPAY